MVNSIVNREQTKIDEADKKFIVFRPVRLLPPAVEPQFERKSSLEYSAWPGRQIECKPIGALTIVRIEIVEGSAVEDRLVRWPFPYRNA